MTSLSRSFWRSTIESKIPRREQLLLLVQAANKARVNTSIMNNESKMYPDLVEKDFSIRNPVLPGVDPLIAHRYSPRAFRPHKLAEQTIKTLFDGARQAPSCFNEQPWRFYCSSDASFDQFLELLVPQNAEWAKNASAIAVVTATSHFAHNDKPNAHSWFDAGAAWYALAYQARTMGLYTHAMAGIHTDKIVEELNIPSTQSVICAVAIGVIDDSLAEQEDVSPRKSLDEILFIR